jgi:hypothetical protein
MSIESVATIVGLVVIATSIVLYLRAQRGTAGPHVGSVPRPLRRIANAWFAIMDWPIPFDRAGEQIPVEERRRARDN